MRASAGLDPVCTHSIYEAIWFCRAAFCEANTQHRSSAHKRDTTSEFATHVSSTCWNFCLTFQKKPLLPAYGAAAPHIAQQSTRSMNRKRNSCSLAFWWITFNFRELDLLDTSNSVAAATVVDGNQLRIPQGKKKNLEAPRVLSGVAHREYPGEIHRLHLAPSSMAVTGPSFHPQPIHCGCLDVQR